MTTVTAPALSVWQPWASLWERGLKPLETRHFAPPQRLLDAPLIAIHAAAKKPTGQMLAYLINATLASDLPQAGDALELLRRYARSPVPPELDRTFGAVIAVGRLAAGYRFDLSDRTGHVKLRGSGPLCPNGRSAEIPEDPWGDYTPGRWGWQLTDIRMLEKPFPMQGRQMIGWPCALPQGVLDVALQGEPQE
jgi:activating signal cointegrator 1